MIDLLSEIFNDMKHRAVSLRQLSFLSNVLLCLDDGKLPLGNKIYIVDNSEDDRTSPGISGGSRLPALGGPRGGQKFTPGGMEI